MLKREFWPLVREGKKRITIRKFAPFRPGEIVQIHSGGKIVGEARIVNVYRKKLGEIGKEEARKEGMPLSKLLRLLRRTYGDDPELPLTVVEFDLIRTYDPPLDPERLHYGEITPQQIAKMALEAGIVDDDGERRILEALASGKSIREIAFEMGGLHKRKMIRRIIRKYGEVLGATPS